MQSDTEHLSSGVKYYTLHKRRYMLAGTCTQTICTVVMWKIVPTFFRVTEKILILNILIKDGVKVAKFVSFDPSLRRLHSRSCGASFQLLAAYLHRYCSNLSAFSSEVCSLTLLFLVVLLSKFELRAITNFRMMIKLMVSSTANQS